MKGIAALHLPLYRAAEHQVNRHRKGPPYFLQPIQSRSGPCKGYTQLTQLPGTVLFPTPQVFVQILHCFLNKLKLFHLHLSPQSCFLSCPHRFTFNMAKLTHFTRFTFYLTYNQVCWRILHKLLSAKCLFHCFRHRVIPHEDVLAAAFPNKLTLYLLYEKPHLCLHIHTHPFNFS